MYAAGLTTAAGSQDSSSTHVDAIGFLVRPEQRVGHWHFDDLYGAPLGIWGAGQPVVGVQRDLVLHHRTQEIKSRENPDL